MLFSEQQQPIVPYPSVRNPPTSFAAAIAYHQQQHQQQMYIRSNYPSDHTRAHTAVHVHTPNDIGNGRNLTLPWKRPWLSGRSLLKLRPISRTRRGRRRALEQSWLSWRSRRGVSWRERRACSGAFEAFKRSVLCADSLFSVCACDVVIKSLPLHLSTSGESDAGLCSPPEFNRPSAATLLYLLGCLLRLLVYRKPSPPQQGTRQRWRRQRQNSLPKR